MDRPETSEFNPYYGKYIALVDSHNIIATLTAQANETVALLSALQESQGEHRYAPGKWTVKELLGHVIDTERIFAYRALRIARNDATPLAGYEQDDYVANGGYDKVSLGGLIEEFRAVRLSTVLLLANLSAGAWTRRGTANQNEISVRALAWIIAGHELHHRAILREKYLTA